MKANVEQLILIPTSGQPIDISDMVSEFNIYQSLNDHYMYCDLVILDTIGLNRVISQDESNKYSGGFTGGEIVLFQYWSSHNPTTEHAFMIYERSDVTKQNDVTTAYVLNGMSIEGFETHGRKISRAFGKNGGKKISDMIKNVYGEFFNSGTLKDIYREISKNHRVTIEKKLYLDDKDSGLHKFVIPNLSVDETINFMCNECDTKDHIPRYFFFEDTDGFHFNNLGFIAEREPKMTYWFTEFNVDDNLDQRKIISFKIKKGANLINDAQRGLFKSKTIRLDLLKKKKTEKIFDYSKSVDKFKKLQPTQKRGDVASPDVNVTMLTTRNGHDRDTLFRDEAPFPKKVDGFLGERRSYTTEIFTNKLSVVVPGTTTLNVGEVVELNFPFKDAQNSDSLEVKLDKELSGKYIITKLRNKIEDVTTASNFVTIFDCVKDTEILGD
jgi:hypothetical protein